MEVKKSKKAKLENKKVLFREAGLALTLVVVLAAFEWPSREKSVAMLNDTRALTTEEEMIAIKQDNPPPPPELPKAPIVRDVFTIVDVTEELAPVNISTEDHPLFGVDITGYIDRGGAEPSQNEEFPFVLVEDKPMFMGGSEKEFTKWLSKNIVYPESASANGVQGRVIVQFVVAVDGSVADIKVLRGIDPALDKEAVRVISMSPKWTPGKQRGKPVRVQYQFPVIFRLQ
jgi:protein TonB